MRRSAVGMNGNSRVGTAASVVLTLVALALSACESKIDLPDDLTGTYVTSDAPYANRHFSLTPSQITLGVSDGRTERHAIQAVYRDFEDGRALYKVVYVTSYGKDNLLFYHDGADRNGEIVLKNRPGIHWTKGEPR